MAVFSNDESIDAVGACIGYKGARVNSIVDSLRGEKIDIINYSKDIETFISNALSPADIVEVLVNEKNKQSLVVVEDDQLSLAIGKEGQNARLAARLTGWKIDIKSKLEFDSLSKDEIDEILGLNEEDPSDEAAYNLEEDLEENLADEEDLEDEGKSDEEAESKEVLEEETLLDENSEDFEEDDEDLESYDKDIEDDLSEETDENSYLEDEEI